jgi:hypothetical protein
MQAKLTQQLVRAAQAGTTDLTITDPSLLGFELRIRPSGTQNLGLQVSREWWAAAAIAARLLSGVTG